MSTKPTNASGAPQAFWLWVLCLVGLDYFSSLGYQPSIAFEAAGPAAPLATVVLVIVTLCGAFPVYAYIARRSPNGQGATGLLERTVHGWLGKFLVLVLLGFAATDFVITKTLSIADAAEHLIHNPLPAWQQLLQVLGTADDSTRRLLPFAFWRDAVGHWNPRLLVALILSVLGFIFWSIFRRGFRRRVLQLAVASVATYLLLNAIVVASGLLYLTTHPHLVVNWWQELTQPQSYGEPSMLWGANWSSVILLCLLAFPKMSLGLSGFELSMVVMPLVKGHPSDKPEDLQGRVRNARKLLYVAAAIMSLYLLGSTIVTTTLIARNDLLEHGPAANRALAYLAHGSLMGDGTGANALNSLFGETFGTIYDFVTVMVLCLAGTSVTLGLRSLVPQYLHRLGMELTWAHNVGAILHLFNCVNILIIVIFRASVTAQRGAYATSVLVLIGSAALVGGLDLWEQRAGDRVRRLPWYFLFVGALFLVSALAVILAKPDGLLIALSFIAALLLSSIISRVLRSTELRFEGFEFQDAQSQFLWESLKYLEFPILVPHRPGQLSLLAKEESIRMRHRLAPDIPVVFVEAKLGDASDFYHKPLVCAVQEDGRIILRVTRCTSIAHVIAAVALELSRVGKPPEIHFGWSAESPVTANINFLFFGQGNIPWMVRELIRKAEPVPARQPPVVIG